MKRIVLAVCVLSLVGGIGWGQTNTPTPTVTPTPSATAAVTPVEQTYASPQKVKFTWLSDDAGNATLTTTAVFSGDIVAVATDPADASPTDNYDVELFDSDNFDVLLGSALNRDAVNTEYIKRADLGAVAQSRLRFVISNAGARKQGVVAVWIK